MKSTVFEKKRIKLMKEKSCRQTTELMRYKKLFGEIPSIKGYYFTHYIAYKLKMYSLFHTKIDLFASIANLKFQRFQQKQRSIFLVLKRITKNQLTLLFIGRSPISANSPIKGYQRVGLLEFEQRCIQLDHIHLIYVDEFNSTQKCPKCRGQLIISKSPNRFVICPNCVTYGNDVLPQPEVWRTRENAEWRIRDPLQPDIRTTSGHRDLTSAQNEMCNGLSLVKNIPLHPVFQRPKRAQTQAKRRKSSKVFFFAKKKKMVQSKEKI